MIHSTLTGDGTEQTRGFYSYYLTSHTMHHHDNVEHTSFNRIKPLRTGSKRIKLDSTKEMFGKRETAGHIQRKYFAKKAKIHADAVKHTTQDVRQSNSIREKRVKRHVTNTTALTDTSTVQNRHDNRAANNTRTQQQESVTSNNDTTTNVTRNGTLSQKHNDKQVEGDAKMTKLPNNDKTKHHHGKKTTSEGAKHTDSHAKPRTKRFLQLFSRPENDDSFVFRALNFLVKNRKSVVPIVSVVRDVSTLVRSGRGELNHVTREQNNYVGVAPPDLAPVSYSLELGNESRVLAFMKRLLGLAPKGDRLTVGSG